MIIRRPTPADATAMADLLNAIIAIGGTTAHQHPKSTEQIRHGYIDGPDVKTSVLAEDAGRIIGFQSIELWQGEMHIGTFVQPGLQAKGVGAALFAETRRQARAAGLTTIIAAIRADNVPGLAYYARIGFRDIGGDPGFALEDGRVVGRIYRQFDL
jgi:L-amino acid N-acyltransferase YncA